MAGSAAPRRATPAPARSPTAAQCGSPWPWSLLLREVLGAPVVAAVELGVLPQQVGEQRGGADPEALRRQPVVAERLLDEHEHVQRRLGGADAAGRLDAD